MRGAILTATFWGAIGAAPALAVSDADVRQFVQLSDRFNAKLSRSETAGLSAAQRQLRGQCILERLEQSHGAPGVAALMSLMQVLASGAEFDDPTVVDFNAQYGSAYNAATRNCLTLARSS